MKIHGGTVFCFEKRASLAWYARYFTSLFKIKTLTKKILNTKDYLTNNIKKNVLASWSKDHYFSKENKLRSLNSCYCHNVLGIRKYLSLRKANEQTTLANSKLPNFDNALFKEIGSIDIVTLCEINEHFGIKQEKVGLF